MGYSIPINNGIISICYTDFKCPICNYIHQEEDWYTRYEKSKHGLIYMNCKGCKSKIGVTINIMGDVVTWDKKTEKK